MRLTTTRFRDDELMTVNGLIMGVAFTVDAALGLYAWATVVVHFGWRNALLIGAAVGAITFVALLVALPKPPGIHAQAAKGSHLDRAALKRVFGNRDLWILGLSFVGGYGGYFTAAELLPAYAQQHLSLGQAEADSIDVILLISGIPGSFIDGRLADKLFGIIPTIVGAWLIKSATLLMVPYLGASGLPVAAAIIGATAILGFVAWIAVPGLYRHSIHISDVPTACGLMLTIVAIGGVFALSLYGKIAASCGLPECMDLPRNHIDSDDVALPLRPST
jgi:ACS family D-galactonate transporter-like MFS transporter